MHRLARLRIVLIALAAGGCVAPVAETRYPSLLPRPIETRSDAEPQAAPPAVVADPATDARIADVRAALRVETAAFDAAAALADRSADAAHGDPVGGERWIAAQAALADLERHRATVSAELSTIDDLALQRAGDGLPPYPALDALRETAQAAVEREAARITEIAAQLPSA